MTDDELLEIVGGTAFAEAPVRLTGGFWAELVAFRLEGDARAVARFMPDPATAAKETCIQRTVADLGFPTPAVRRWGGAEAGGGRAFMVMDRVDGQPLLAGLDGFAAIRRLPSLAREIPAVLGTTMATLHRLDATAVRTRLHAEGIQVRGALELARHLAQLAEACGRADLVAAAEWLLARPPVDGEVVVCHGDLHPFNVLVDDSGAPVVLDWSASLLAAPEYDVAFTELLLSEPPLALPGVARPAVGAAGRLLARRFRRAYLAAGGLALDDGSLRWHQALLCLRSLVEVAGWVATGTVAAHAGHPWLTIESALTERLAAIVGHSQPMLPSSPGRTTPRS